VKCGPAPFWTIGKSRVLYTLFEVEGLFLE
jgi:hypothetical protein